MSYAADTSVPVDRSRAEIEAMLTRRGATAFGYAQQGGRAAIMFRLPACSVRIELQLPSAKEFAVSERGRTRKVTAQQQAWAQACRARWRALALVIKAKLVAVDAGITTVEKEFQADLVLPDGRRVGDVVAAEYRLAVESRGNHGLRLLGGAS